MQNADENESSQRRHGMFNRKVLRSKQNIYVVRVNACVSACTHRRARPAAPVKLHATLVCFITGELIWSLRYYFQWFAASRAAEKWKEQGSLLSKRCSLPLKGHVVFPGNWLNGFGFCDIRSGHFHSAWVSRGTCLPVVFTLTSLPSPGDELGTDRLRPGACLPRWTCPSLRASVGGCGCFFVSLILHLSQKTPALSHWKKKPTEVGVCNWVGSELGTIFFFLFKKVQGRKRQRERRCQGCRYCSSVHGQMDPVKSHTKCPKSHNFFPCGDSN